MLFEKMCWLTSDFVKSKICKSVDIEFLNLNQTEGVRENKEKLLT